MRTGQRNTLLFSLLSYAGLTVQQKDPNTEFCRRWGHQAAVVDDKLFIDGGLITIQGDNDHKNRTNQFLVAHDLTSNGTTGMPPPTTKSKNSTIPSVNGGILWPDTVNKRIYLFGGQYTNEKPWDLNLYSYDVLNDYWDELPMKTSDDISGVSYGAGLAIPSRGEAYYYGGWISEESSPNWKGDAMAVSNLLVYNMDSNSWTNTTGPDDKGRAEGVMQFIPAGDGGMTVYLGGVRGTGLGKWEEQPMDEIIIYDVLSAKSYTQTASGTIPKSRRRFCAGVTWAEDQSSYNIYLYGGEGAKDGSPSFDDAYVLSIPSFEWIKIYPQDNNSTNSTGDYPHYGMSCNVVKDAQMIIHGGFFPDTDDCDAETQWGLHNMDLGEQNSDKSPWALWNPSKTTYVVPDDIVSVIGGSKTGGATKTEPSGGWDHNDLKALMTRTASLASTRTPTRAVGDSTSTASSDASADGNSSSGISGGAIAGIVVGAVVGVALIAGALWFFLRKRRQPPAAPVPVAGTPQTMMSQPYAYHQPPSSVSPGPNGTWDHSMSPASGYASMTPPPFHKQPSPVPQGYSYVVQQQPMELPNNAIYPDGQPAHELMSTEITPAEVSAHEKEAPGTAR